LIDTPLEKLSDPTLNVKSLKPTPAVPSLPASCMRAPDAPAETVTVPSSKNTEHEPPVTPLDVAKVNVPAEFSVAVEALIGSVESAELRMITLAEVSIDDNPVGVPLASTL
jgi:hypothetical protein